MSDINPHIKKVVEEFQRTVDKEVFGVSTTSNLPAPTLTYEKLLRIKNRCTPKRITIGNEQFDVYGYNVHKGEGWTVLTRMRDEDELFDLNAPLGGGVIIIYHTEGKVLGTEEELKHLASHSELVIEPENG